MQLPAALHKLRAAFRHPTIKSTNALLNLAGEGLCLPLPLSTAPVRSPVGGCATVLGPPNLYKTNEKSTYSLLAALRVFLAALGALPGCSWAALGRSWALLGRSWPLLGCSGGTLGCSWAALGRSWDATSYL